MCIRDRSKREGKAQNAFLRSHDALTGCLNWERYNDYLVAFSNDVSSSLGDVSKRQGQKQEGSRAGRRQGGGADAGRGGAMKASRRNIVIAVVLLAVLLVLPFWPKIRQALAPAAGEEVSCTCLLYTSGLPLQPRPKGHAPGQHQEQAGRPAAEKQHRGFQDVYKRQRPDA